MPSGFDRTDITVVISAVVAAAGVVAGLTFDKTLGAVVTAAGVIVTSLFGYLKARRADATVRRSALEVANISAATALETTSKTVLVQTVTAERAKWRSEMREIVTGLVALLRASSRGETVDWREVDRLRTGIRLRLNPEGRGLAPAGIDRHGRDRRLHGDLDALAQSGAGDASVHKVVAEELERHMADLLKGEWDKSKDEAVTGKLKVG